ncbi:MAG: protein translocase subunit SecD [Sedimentisphaerales bacterium]|nr:protein translocase subunit SecD [Sedimentisphaerales bacterium]
MNKNLVPKSVLVVVLVALALWTLYPPSETLKQGIDLAGGTSMIYAIDTEGMTPDEEKDLAQRMITVLRRRIDPANIQNLIWRPQGNTRFEIQMPLASKETQERRQAYDDALDALLRKNVNPATIMRALQQPEEQRMEDLRAYAMNDPNRLEILTDLASIYDERAEAQNQRDTLTAALDSLKEKLSEAGVDVERVEANRRDWMNLEGDTLTETLTDFLDPNDPLPILTEYVNTYKQQVDVLDRLTRAGGLNDRYEEAKRHLDQLNLTQDQITYALQLRANSAQRTERLEALKAQFPDRVAEIDRVVEAFDAYSPFQGQLDDPRDLQRMLKGAGILEFRILPTQERSELSTVEMERYVQTLMEKGPGYRLDNNHVWCEIENIEEWAVEGAVVAPFGDKYYVLASNQPNETMLHEAGSPDWSLEKANPSTDTTGRRAIAFRLDDKGGSLFWNLTQRNPGRPLCILLDKIAISAPEINPERPIGSEGLITGSFTQQQVNDMVNKLNAGSLPGRLIEQPISEKTIGPSIGAENRDQGITAGIIGLIVVMAVMLGYYIRAGAIADVALVLNILFVLAIMAGLRATFTLPGIAGIILTIGMSVDANVLIFERIREEQQKGSGLAVAIKNGYQRAFRAIFDSNLTTFITAAILYYVASEEIKGFAIVLMLGIASSMFTALFVTRVVFDFLVSKRVIKDQIKMLRLIREPNINWMGLRKVFLAISGALIVLGLLVFFTRDDAENNKYDIEFTGGTSVQINLKPDVALTRQDVEDRIILKGQELGNPALQAANVYSLGEPTGTTSSGESTFGQYEITTTATNMTRAVVTFSPGAAQSIDSMTAAIREAQAESNRDLSNLSVGPAAGGADSFVVSTTRVNPSVMRNILEKAFPTAQVAEPEIDEVVSNAVREAFEGQLEIQQNLEPVIVAQTRITDAQVDTYPELAQYIGGIQIEVRLGTPASLDEIDSRLKELRFKPDTQGLTWYPYALFGPDLKPVDANQPLESFVYVSTEPEAGLRELTEEEWDRFVANEKSRVLAATQLEATLPRVTQIDPSVGSEQKTRALIAIFLSLSAIVGYVWVRFGNFRYGVAAIVALVHDVIITLGAVTACAYIATTPIGSFLLIGDFKINLAMIAALLTLIGYSLNDTIVVFDRIRENRHKAQLTPQTITNSINQTLSRTIMTSFTTFIVVLVMYIWGGPGLRGFTFAIGFGVVIGTYSSIAIASPLLLFGMKAQQGKQKS